LVIEIFIISKSITLTGYHSTLMAMLGSSEILLVFLSIIFLLIPIALVIFIIYVIVKGRDGRVKALESRIDQLEKEKIIDERITSLEKRFDELQKK
jgi:uncharacterized membrane protein